MKKGLCFLFILCMFSISLLAQETSGEGAIAADYAGVEIPNTIGAVKNANPGDYILLKSGKKYILTKEEIAIVRGDFDYNDLSGVETEYREDGTEIKTISQAHSVYAYPDGQFAHLLKTHASFSAYMRYIEKKYYIALYIDYFGEYHEYIPIESRSLNVFRAVVEIQTISDGFSEMEAITISVFNHKGENYMMKYCAEPDMFWGNISDEGVFRPTGESRQLEFDIE